MQASIVLILLTILVTTPTKILANTSGLNLQIINPNQQNISLTNDDILTLPKTTVYAELSCYSNPISNGKWSGVKISDLLSQEAISPTAGSLDFLAADGYKVTIPIETAMRPDVIIAYELDENPLQENLRLVIPGSNGNLWISMIALITLSTTQVSGGESLDAKSIIFNQYPGLTSPNGVPATQHPAQVQTQTIASENKASINPTTSPTNMIENQSERQS